jgi:hypothetical protein
MPQAGAITKTTYRTSFLSDGASSRKTPTHVVQGMILDSEGKRIPSPNEASLKASAAEPDVQKQHGTIDLPGLADQL